MSLSDRQKEELKRRAAANKGKGSDDDDAGPTSEYITMYCPNMKCLHRRITVKRGTKECPACKGRLEEAW